MSKADEMLLQAYFKKEWVEDENDVELFRKELFVNSFIEVFFDKEHELLNITQEDIAHYRIITSILSVKDLIAINEKVKELGWLDE